MIYGLIISQSRKRVVSTKQMTHMWIKKDEASDLYKIKAATSDKRKVTLGKFHDKEVCELIFEYAYLFWGKDIYDGDEEYDRMRTMTEVNAAPDCTLSVDGNNNRFYIPEEEEAVKYIDDAKKRNKTPFVTAPGIKRHPLPENKEDSFLAKDVKDLNELDMAELDEVFSSAGRKSANEKTELTKESSFRYINFHSPYDNIELPDEGTEGYVDEDGLEELSDKDGLEELSDEERVEELWRTYFLNESEEE